MSDYDIMIDPFMILKSLAEGPGIMECLQRGVPLESLGEENYITDAY